MVRLDPAALRRFVEAGDDLDEPTMHALLDAVEERDALQRETGILLEQHHGDVHTLRAALNTAERERDAAQAANVELRRIAGEAEQRNKSLDVTVRTLQEENAALRARVAAAGDVLRKYGQHVGCPGWMASRYPCKCGLSDALRAFDATAPKKD